MTFNACAYKNINSIVPYLQKIIEYIRDNVIEVYKTSA